MEGEPVNISNIEKKIRDEITEASSRVKEGFDDVTDKVKNADYKKYKSRAKSGSQDFIETLGRIITTFFMVIGKFIGVLLLIISVATILGLLVGLFAVGSLDFIHEDWFYQNSMIYNNSGLPIWSISILTFILVGIPFFFLFSLGLRILSNNTKTIGKVGRLSLLGIWIVALLVTIYFGTRQYMQTAYDGSVIESQEINYMESDTIQLKLVDNKKLSDNGILKHRWGYSIVYDENDTERIYSNNIRLNVYQSDNDNFYIKTRKKSQGSSRNKARENAQMISYDFDLMDNELNLNGYFLADADHKYREQKVYVDLYIPIDKIVLFDKSARTFIYDVENIQDIYDRDMAEHYFKMTSKGLTCLDCDDDLMNGSEDNESFNMKIDRSGVRIKVQDKDNDKAEVKIDENGVLISSSKDSVE